MAKPLTKCWKPEPSARGLQPDAKVIDELFFDVNTAYCADCRIVLSNRDINTLCDAGCEQ